MQCSILRPIAFIIIFIMITACHTAEEFRSIDTSHINRELSKLGTTISPEQVLKIYYPHEAGHEGTEELTISQKTLSSGSVELTLVHDHLPDDSIMGQKVVMELKRDEEGWTVLSLKTNWRCRIGRGHTTWGIDLCH